MKIKSISKGQIPPEGQYVLIRVRGRLWRDRTDNYGVFWKVAKCVYGISMDERLALAKSDDYLEHERAKQYRPEDEHGNNGKPYYFSEFGPGTFLGQEVDEWCELPGRKIDLEEKIREIFFR